MKKKEFAKLERRENGSGEERDGNVAELKKTEPSSR